MKKQATLFFFILLSSCAMAGERVQFKISKPFCLMVFMRAAGGDASLSRTLEEYIPRHISRRDSAKFNHLVREFSTINFGPGYSFAERPEHRERPKQLSDLVSNAAIQSNDLPEFMSRITGMFSNEDWQKLKNVLTAAEPYYDEMLLQPYEKIMEQQLHALEQNAKRADAIFYKLKTFYGSVWSNDMPFIIGIYTIPGEKGYTTASPHSNCLALGVFTEEHVYEERISVALHEMCHVLYDEQSLKLQRKIESAFLQSRSPAALFAYNYFDEALATACGNGWIYSVLTDSLDKGSWYYQDYIDRYGKAIYPMVKEYIEAGRTIDRSFVNRSINLFEKTFPNAAYEYTNLLNNINFYTDADDHKQYRDIYRKLAMHFQITNSGSWYPVAQSMDRVSAMQGTQIFIIHSNHNANYKLLEKDFPEIKGLDPAGEGVISFYDQKKRPVIILNAKSMGRIEKVVLQMEKQNHIDPKVLFTPLQ